MLFGRIKNEVLEEWESNLDRETYKNIIRDISSHFFRQYIKKFEIKDNKPYIELNEDNIIENKIRGINGRIDDVYELLEDIFKEHIKDSKLRKDLLQVYVTKSLPEVPSYVVEEISVLAILAKIRPVSPDDFVVLKSIAEYLHALGDNVKNIFDLFFELLSEIDTTKNTSPLQKIEDIIRYRYSAPTSPRCETDVINFLALLKSTEKIYQEVEDKKIDKEEKFMEIVKENLKYTIWKNKKEEKLSKIIFDNINKESN